MPYFETADRCSLYYETEGAERSGPIVVFLNGTMQTTVYWKALATRLKDRFRVLMYDARSQGQSGLGEQDLSLEVHTSDLAALLVHIGAERTHLVGLSHGAKVALASAARFPGLVDRIVLCSVGSALSIRAKLIISSWLEILDRSGLETMARAALPVVFGEKFLARQERILPTIVEAIVARNSAEGLIAHLKAVSHDPSLKEIAQSAKAPCLVVSGTDDPLVTEKAAQELASLCNGSYERFAGAGHSVPAEAPDSFGETVYKFLCKP